MKKFLTAGLSLAALAGKVAAADLPVKAPPQLPAYDWTGFYLGGHIGYAWGSSSWSTTGASGAFSLAEPIDVFSETGSLVVVGDSTIIVVLEAVHVGAIWLKSDYVAAIYNRALGVFL